MLKTVKEQNLELNRLWRMQDQLYQAYATRCGLSFRILLGIVYLK